MTPNYKDNLTPEVTYLTQVELAQKLGVHRDTIVKWSLRGLIPKIKIGKRSVRYDLAKVREFLSATPEPKAPERTAPESNESKTKASKVGKRNAKK